MAVVITVDGTVMFSARVLVRSTVVLPRVTVVTNVVIARDSIDDVAREAVYPK